jgi:c-di-GMP-binding flagellar brake protein YcgR
MASEQHDDRRKFRRLKAPVFYRPVGLSFLRRLRGKDDREQAIDISLGGVRIYSDDELKVGSRLELDLFLPDDTTLATKAVVVWVHELPSGGPAKYDVGVRFDEMDDSDQQRLSHVLDEEGP